MSSHCVSRAFGWMQEATGGTWHGSKGHTPAKHRKTNQGRNKRCLLPAPPPLLACRRRSPSWRAPGAPTRPLAPLCASCRRSATRCASSSTATCATSARCGPVRVGMVCVVLELLPSGPTALHLVPTPPTPSPSIPPPRHPHFPLGPPPAPQKDVVITKCWHMFCGECIRRNLETRHRKCPGCGAPFGQGDVKSFFFT